MARVPGLHTHKHAGGRKSSGQCVSLPYSRECGVSLHHGTWLQPHWHRPWLLLSSQGLWGYCSKIWADPSSCSLSLPKFYGTNTMPHLWSVWYPFLLPNPSFLLRLQKAAEHGPEECGSGVSVRIRTPAPPLRSWEHLSGSLSSTAPTSSPM